MIEHPDQRHADGLAPKGPEIRKLYLPRNVGKARHMRVGIARHRKEDNNAEALGKLDDELGTEEVRTVDVVRDEKENSFHKARLLSVVRQRAELTGERIGNHAVAERRQMEIGRNIEQGTGCVASVREGRREIYKEILHYFAACKRRWLLPVVVFLFILSALMIASSNAVLAPFIYTLF